MGHPIHKHMHTHITKSNVKAAIKDDKAHMDYLKRDVKDDQKAGGKYKDINQTADEKHISKLAGDVKYDEKKEGMSRYEYEGMSRMGGDAKPTPSKEEYSIGQKLVGTAKNVGDYVSGAYNKSEVLAGIGVTNPHGSEAERKHDLGKSKEAFARAKKRKSEGSAFFMESDGQEEQDLMNYNPIDDRAGMSMKSPMKKSPMYDKGHQGDGDGHVHPRTQGEQDVMSKHINKFNDFTNKASKFGNMTEAQLQRVKDRQGTLNAQITKTRDSIGNVHRNFDKKRDADFDALFDDGK